MFRTHFLSYKPILNTVQCDGRSYVAAPALSASIWAHPKKKASLR